MTSERQRPSQKAPKKSEMLEVRLPHQTKQDFVAACHKAGRTVSDVLREAVQDFIDAENQKRPEPQPGKLIAMISRPIRKHRFVVAGAGVVGLALAAALPSAAAPDMRAMFDRLDVDKDGVISLTEFAKPPAGDTVVRKAVRLGKPAATAQAPGAGDAPITIMLPPAIDGKLPEMKAATFQSLAAVDQKTLAEFRNTQFASFDSDGDGKVTYVEYAAQQTRMLTNGFNRMDKNKDGSLSSDEYAAISQPVLLTELDADLSSPTAAKYGSVVSEDAVKARFTGLDANKDGKLSTTEYLAELKGASAADAGLALLPDTSIGRLSRGFFEAANTLEWAKLKAFLTASFPAALNNPQFETIQEMSKGFDVIKVEPVTDKRLDVWVELRSTKQQHKMIILLDDANPQQLRTIALLM